MQQGGNQNDRDCVNDERKGTMDRVSIVTNWMRYELRVLRNW